MVKLNNKGYFKVPKGYFKDFNKNLLLKRTGNPFTVPSNYFEEFQINTKKIKSQRILINLNKMIMPVAASIIFGFFIFNLLPNSNDFEIDYEVELYSFFQMVVQILADPGKVMEDGDAVGLQLFCGTDPRQHQDLRRLHGAGRQDHLAVA